MKYLLLFSLSLFSAASFAVDSKDHKMMKKKMDKMSFEDAKEMHLKMIDKKTSMLDDEKKCVNDSKDKTDLNKCMKDMWKEHKSMKADMKDKMHEKTEDAKEEVKKM